MPHTIHLQRNFALEKTTPGQLYLPKLGKCPALHCATMELQPQSRSGGRKIAGVTRFEQGVYPLRVWTSDAKIAAKSPHAIHTPGSKWARRYTPKFGGAVEICVGTESDGDEWKATLAHGGNESKHTLGCTLLGESYLHDREFLANSGKAIARIYPELVKRALQGAVIEVVNPNHA